MQNFKNPIQKTDIEGLEWYPNYVAKSGPDSFYVIETPGGGVTDMLFYPDKVNLKWLAIHVGQIDRLTFLGNPNEKIQGVFVDCRKNSKSIHKKVVLDINPDPTKHLLIERGIAHGFSGLKNVTVRVETLWYVDENNDDYNLASDSNMFSVDEKKEFYPIVNINKNKVPDEVMQFVLSQQQNSLSKGNINSSLSNYIYFNGKKSLITLKSK